ncbi:hypothetical protein F5Y04DRAFT_286092 [Hypomontagnella monticulosa]|nr:hypothetical protein F5Y04DRAFT_286092 [Hypomontagnella monticulosa]
MFSRPRWPFTSSHHSGEPSNHHKDERRHRSRHRDPSRGRRRIDLDDLDYDVTHRGPIHASVKDSWQLHHLAEVLKKQFSQGDEEIPEDAEIQFFSIDKRLDGGNIPKESSVLFYRVLPEGDDGSLQIIWHGLTQRLSKSEKEMITREAAAGRSVGSLRETIADHLQASSENRRHVVEDANQITIEATGGFKEGYLQGNSWEVRKVKIWFCRYLIVDIVHRDDYLVLRGFNEQYVWHKPPCNHRGITDIHKLKAWLRDEILESPRFRRSRRHSLDVEDIRLTYRGKSVKRYSHIRTGGDAIDFEVPRTAEDKYVRAEAELVPLTETCIVCSDEKRVSEMPNRRRITSACEHDSSVCKDCVGQWIASSMERVAWDRLKCPECPQLLKFENVRAFAAKDVFNRYDALATKAFLSNVPEFIWCLNPRCNSGQIFPTGCERARCHACKHSLCVRHNVPWHKGETCPEYERRTRRQRRNDKASEKHVKEIAKPCPGCKKNVHKYTGCDHVTCICGDEWCWLCFGKYYRDDHDFLQCNHTRECRYHDNPPNYEGGRAFIPFLNMVVPPRPPEGPPAHAIPRPNGPPPHMGIPIPINRPPAPPPRRAPEVPNDDLVEFFLRRHMNRNPFEPNINVHLARAQHLVQPPDPRFFDDALFFNLGHLMQRAGRHRGVDFDDL